jgi:hypothetical protein
MVIKKYFENLIASVKYTMMVPVIEGCAGAKLGELVMLPNIFNRRADLGDKCVVLPIGV